MRKLLLLPTLMVLVGVGHAQEVGRVISSTPMIQQVGVPRQVCTTEQVAVQAQKSGAGAAIGAIAGGAMGNAIGHGAGQAAATMLGIVGGAIVGDNVEGAPPAQVQNVQHCAVQTFYENRTVAYNVLYEFAGKQFSVQMPNNPGPTINLQVTPVGALTQAPMQYTQPMTVVSAMPAPVVYAQPYYPPMTVDLGVGYWGGRRWR